MNSLQVMTEDVECRLKCAISETAKGRKWDKFMIEGHRPSDIRPLLY